MIILEMGEQGGESFIILRKNSFLMKYILENKGNRLFILLGSFFITNALVAEFVGVKIFSLEKVFGLIPVNLTLFGQGGLSFNLTAGVLLWPIVFVMTDIINEYYGKRGVRILSFLAAGLISYAFIIFFTAIHLPPADFWINKNLPDGQVMNMNMAYNNVFGQGLWIIIGSLVAFLLGQMMDVFAFHFIKKKTGEKMIWLRATGSTLISQFIDSFVVLYIAFYIGADWDLKLVLAIGVVNYIYKVAMAIVLTPVIYLVHGWIENYLGHEFAKEMKKEAIGE